MLIKKVVAITILALSSGWIGDSFASETYGNQSLQGSYAGPGGGSFYGDVGVALLRMTFDGYGNCVWTWRGLTQSGITGYFVSQSCVYTVDADGRGEINASNDVFGAFTLALLITDKGREVDLVGVAPAGVIARSELKKQ